MNDQQQSIALSELLTEVDLDLDGFRKKHSTDFGVKNITMWWELEKERLLLRHGSVAAVRKVSRTHSFRRLMFGFLAGWIFSVALGVGTRLLMP